MASFVPLTLAGGGTLYVNPETVDTIEDAVGLVPPACFVTFTGEDTGTRVTVAGTAAAVSAALASGGGGGIVSGSYTPTLASAPIAPVLGITFSADWRYLETPTGVFVWGDFEVNWLGAGTGIVLVNAPPGLTGDPLTLGLGGTDALVPPPGGFPIGCDFRGVGALGELSWEIYNNAGSPQTRHGFAVWYKRP